MPGATPGYLEETRRTFVLDSIDRLPSDALRASLRFEGALWEAAIDVVQSPTDPPSPAQLPRLHLFRRQLLWTMHEAPARRRPFWIGVANIPFLQDIPPDTPALATSAAWHLNRALGPIARQRVQALTLAASVQASEMGIEKWSLDLDLMTLGPTGLFAISQIQNNPPLQFPVPPEWRSQIRLLLSAEREGMLGGHERLAVRRFLTGEAPRTAHARQCLRLRLDQAARRASKP